MDPELAAVVAENNLRRQHKFRNGWGKADQRDQNKWERHDSNPRLHKEPYGICKLCHPVTPIPVEADSE